MENRLHIFESWYHADLGLNPLTGILGLLFFRTGAKVGVDRFSGRGQLANLSTPAEAIKVIV